MTEQDFSASLRRKIIWALLLLLVSLGALLVALQIGIERGQNTALARQNEDNKTEQASDESNKEAARQKGDPNDPNDKKTLRPLHEHPAFDERVTERMRMVKWQIAARDVDDPNVLRAMRVVPRHAFIPPNMRRYAYADRPLPIGLDQTISQPYIVAFMTEALQLKRDSKVLEIGTGSGYQAAVCCEIAKKVYTIEIVEELAKRSRKVLKELGYPNVFVRAGDGFFGWEEHAPYEAIIGTAAAGRVPEPLLEQLRPGGRMILPTGPAGGFQYLVLITKDKNGNLSRKKVMPVRFVPMTGEVQKPQRK